jgi:rRNA maturation protein Nop10
MRVAAARTSSHDWQTPMSHRKPRATLDDHGKKMCPVCGQRTYSANGIHPQCAVLQADAPRQRQLTAKKKADAEKKREERTPPSMWQKKKCPKCGVEVHIRRKSCNCGFDFFAA